LRFIVIVIKGIVISTVRISIIIIYIDRGDVAAPGIAVGALETFVHRRTTGK